MRFAAFCVPNGDPENLPIFGESGGIGRLDDDVVVSPCDSIAERDA